MRQMWYCSSKCYWRGMVFSAALFSGFFFVGSGSVSASQTITCHSIYRYSGGQRIVLRSWWITGNHPSIYEQFPELSGLDHQGGSLGGTYYYPYGYQINSSSSPNFAPYYYYDTGSQTTQQVEDSVSQDDINALNEYYKSLPLGERAAITGFDVAYTSDGTNTTAELHIKRVSPDTIYQGGVSTFDQSGNAVISFPDDSTGYAPGYTQKADGTFQPIYYKIDGNTLTSFSSLPTPAFDSLSVDSSGNYQLSIPDYSDQLSDIAQRISNIDTSPRITVNPSITVQPPDVVVYPEVVVNPTVSVPAPEVTVNVATDLTTVENNQQDIIDALWTSDNSSIPSTNDLAISSEDQSVIDSLRTWETDIPLLGDACDFGLTALFGRIPNIGTEYVWMDLSLGEAKRSKSSSSFLSGFHIRIDLTPYRDILLAIRGWMIIAEALFFIILIYKNVREACQV